MSQFAQPNPTFHMPAEWSSHRATWLAWPHRRSDWPGKFSPIPWVYGEILRVLSRYEQVELLVNSAEDEAAARKVIRANQLDPERITLHRCPTDRSWVRDSGPIFVKNATGDKVALDWHFNAWAKYPDWQNDDRLPKFIAELLGVPRVEPRLRNWRAILEGGSIDVNGDGLLLTTEECLLSTVQHRNPPFDRSDYEELFREFLGIEKVLWLSHGIAGDDTHGHVDDLARFVNTNTIVTVVEKDESDENYRILQENLERLKGMTNQRGEKLEIVTLPMPEPIVFRGQRLPASYANFYIANGLILVPTFNDRSDRIALGLLAELFPNHDVIGVNCVELVFGLGTFHCMTQQEPL
jgi:agmatine deiminase